MREMLLDIHDFRTHFYTEDGVVKAINGVNLQIALGDTDEVVVRVPVAPGSEADHSTLAELQLDIEPGFHVLAVRRGGRYLYRPRGHVRLEAGDELIASGPDEGHGMRAERCGWRLYDDEDSGEHRLEPLRAVGA